ncbi:MAG TPA: hypothetical protein VHA56_10865 [Mucilaginibacter sp.]|nr:hypothetical protein [Mucilaginibacter sp.]
MTRKLTENEISIITWIIKDTEEGKSIINHLNEILVEEMDDGGMGSLRVFKSGNDDRSYSRELGEEFKGLDIDNVPVFISVLLDTDGNFFELDVFKADFSPLRKFPSLQS